MAREKQNYREQLEIIVALYPGRAALTVSEAAEVLGVDRRTIKTLIERGKDPLPATDVSAGSQNKKYIIPISAIARFTV